MAESQDSQVAVNLETEILYVQMAGGELGVAIRRSPQCQGLRSFPSFARIGPLLLGKYSRTVGMTMQQNQTATSRIEQGFHFHQPLDAERRSSPNGLPGSSTPRNRASPLQNSGRR